MRNGIAQYRRLASQLLSQRQQLDRAYIYSHIGMAACAASSVLISPAWVRSHVQYDRPILRDILGSNDLNLAEEGGDGRVGQRYQRLVSKPKWHTGGCVYWDSELTMSTVVMRTKAKNKVQSGGDNRYLNSTPR